MTHPIQIRAASRDDLSAIVRLLAEDELGALREDVAEPLPDSYAKAFDAVEADANNALIVAVSGDEIVGTLQLTFLPNLSHKGAWRAQIEGVRVSRSFRGVGVGKVLVEWAADRARERGCRLVQLTTDKRRHDAIRFYEGLGFTPSHEGMKLFLK